MAETFIPYYIIGYVLTFLSQFCIWVACLLLFIRERSWPGILLFAGSTLVILGNTAGLLIQTLASRTGGPEALIQYQAYMSILNTTFYLIFATGFVLIILKYLRMDKVINASDTE